MQLRTQRLQKAPNRPLVPDKRKNTAIHYYCTLSLVDLACGQSNSTKQRSVHLHHLGASWPSPSLFPPNIETIKFRATHNHGTHLVAAKRVARGCTLCYRLRQASAPSHPECCRNRIAHLHKHYPIDPIAENLKMVTLGK